MDKLQAVEKITQIVQNLYPNTENLNETRLKFYVEKLVSDILDYCHREDFPETLIYTAVELILKRLNDETENELTGSTAPISEVKMDDTSFKFAVNNVDLTGCLSDLDFASIKPKLNLYRRVVSL